MNRAFSIGFVFVVGMGIAVPVIAQPPAGSTQPTPGTPPAPPGTTQPTPGTPPVPPGTTQPTPGTPPPPAGTTQPGTTPPGTTTAPKPAEWPKQVAGRSIGEWIIDLKSVDPTVRDSAVKVLPLFGPETRKLAHKDIVKLIDDTDPGIRINAMLVLQSLGYETKEDMQMAARAMSAAIAKTAPGSMIRLHACRTLANMGPDGFDGMPGVINIAADPSWETRQAVAAALGRLGAPLYDDKPQPTPAPGALPKPPAIKRQASRLAMDKLVYALLKDESAAVRMEAMQSMITLGPPHSPDPAGYIKLVTPYLDEINRRLKLEKDTGVKIWLLVVQMMYDDRTIDANIKKLAEHLSGTDVNYKVQALNAIAVTGPRSKPILAEVIETTKDTDASVVNAGITTLVAMGEAARYAVDDLEKAKTAAKDENIKKMLTEGIKAIKAQKPLDPPAPMPKKEEPKKP